MDLGHPEDHFDVQQHGEKLVQMDLWTKMSKKLENLKVVIFKICL